MGAAAGAAADASRGPDRPVRPEATGMRFHLRARVVGFGWLSPRRATRCSESGGPASPSRIFMLPCKVGLIMIEGDLDCASNRASSRSRILA